MNNCLDTQITNDLWTYNVGRMCLIKFDKMMACEFGYIYNREQTIAIAYD